MIPTVAFIQRMFNVFNARFFDNQLPHIEIKLCKTKRIFGKFVYIKGGYRDLPVRIEISQYFDYPQKNVEEVLIHEMIHYYLCVNNIREKDPHGLYFMAVANGINKASDYNITARYIGEKTNINRKSPKLYHFVTFNYNNNRYFSRVSKNMVEKFKKDNKAGVFKKVTNVEAYETTDTLLDQYSQCSVKLSCYPITNINFIRCKKIA